jgi:5-methylcytosine-specific restriction endonuclease McrA
MIMRKVDEWVGRNDDADPPTSCKLRILDKQDGRCNTCGVRFDVKTRAQFDHVSPLWLSGENRETNLQALCPPCHGKKTATEATIRGKVNRLRSAAIEPKKKSRPLMGSKASGWKKKMDGTVERR